MAAIVTSSAVEMTNGKTSSDAVEKVHKSRPEKPDEEKYKSDLAKAEKEYAAAMDKFVSLLMDSCIKEPKFLFSILVATMPSIYDQIYMIMIVYILIVVYRMLFVPSSTSQHLMTRNLLRRRDSKL